MGCFVVIVVDEAEVACIDLNRTSGTSVVNFTGVPKSLHKIPSHSSTFIIYTSSLDNEVVAPNPLILPHYFDILLCLGNEVLTPNPLKFFKFHDTLLYLSIYLDTLLYLGIHPDTLLYLGIHLDTLLYLGMHLDTPNPLKFLNCLDTLLYWGIHLVTPNPSNSSTFSIHFPTLLTNSLAYYDEDLSIPCAMIL